MLLLFVFLYTSLFFNPFQGFTSHGESNLVYCPNGQKYVLTNAEAGNFDFYLSQVKHNTLHRQNRNLVGLNAKQRPSVTSIRCEDFDEYHEYLTYGVIRYDLQYWE